MKLILCTLLGFAAIVGGLTVLFTAGYIVGIIPYRLIMAEGWPWRKGLGDAATPQTIWLGIAISGFLSLAYLIGKGICQ